MLTIIRQYKSMLLPQTRSASPSKKCISIRYEIYFTQWILYFKNKVKNTTFFFSRYKKLLMQAYNNLVEGHVPNIYDR